MPGRFERAADLSVGRFGVAMYRGPPIDDNDILTRLPVEYRRLLETINGYVAYSGGLHVRGACTSPAWHSLGAAWCGDDAIHRLFPAVAPEDLPFGQDALGDQFVWRDGFVWKLDAETGDLKPLMMTLPEFDAAARADPDKFLALGPLREFQAQGGNLEPGQLLSVIPPFVFKESAASVSYRAVPVLDRLKFLSQLACELRDVPDGGTVVFTLASEAQRPTNG
jgi:hypothetical protein